MGVEEVGGPKSSAARALILPSLTGDWASHLTGGYRIRQRSWPSRLDTRSPAHSQLRQVYVDLDQVADDDLAGARRPQDVTAVRAEFPEIEVVRGVFAAEGRQGPPSDAIPEDQPGMVRVPGERSLGARPQGSG